MPQLIGSIEIRERPQKYPGQPRYKRLDFVRSRRDTPSEEYPPARTIYPGRPVQHYPVPWHLPQWNTLSHQEQRDILWRYGYHQMPHQQLPHHAHQAQHQIEGPPPPPHHAHPAPHAIEGVPEIIALGSNDGHFDDDGEKVDIIPIAPKAKKGKRSKSRPRHSGHSIFDSDSEDDRFRGRHYPSSNASLSSGSSMSSRRTRSRSRRPVRGW